MATVNSAAATTGPDVATLESIQSRVLWLATSMVHHANKVRTRPASGVKVGGHQASSASMVSIMTALWFEHLRAADRVSVKPHAAPVLHAINYLLRLLDGLGRNRRDGDDLERARASLRLVALRRARGRPARRARRRRGARRGRR